MDFHCHLDLYPNSHQVHAEAAKRNVFTWLVTTSPKAFEATSRVLGTTPSVLITPGLHPELVHQRSSELELLLRQIETARAVGEVGLDGSPRYRGSYELQREVFATVVAKCQAVGGRPLSIHSRRAVRDILTELDAHPGYGVAVLHWFTGTKAEARAAEERGCWFSVGPAMFASANGRSLAASLPRDRVVPESDGPFAKVNGEPVLPWCSPLTAGHLASAWGTSESQAAAALEQNALRLLNLMHLRLAHR